MELHIYQVNNPLVGKTYEGKTPLQGVLVSAQFNVPVSLKSTDVNVLWCNEDLFAAFTAAFNGKINVAISDATNSRGGIRNIPNRSFSTVAELYSALGSDITFTHVLDEANNAIWVASFKIVLGNGNIPFGQEKTLNITFGDFSNTEFDAVNHISYDGVVKMYALVAPNDANIAYKLEPYVANTGKVTAVDLDGVSVFAVPVDVDSTTMYYHGRAKQELTAEMLPHFIRVNTSDRLNSFGVTAPFKNWYVMSSTGMRSAEVIAGATQECYGFTSEVLN